jgi:hypothetical protein
MTDQEKIKHLHNVINDILQGYAILEEYTCELVGHSEAEDNETITHANSIVQIALNSMTTH